MTTALSKGAPTGPQNPLLKNRRGSSVSQNKLLQVILGYTYILKYLQSNFIGKILFFGNS